MFSIFTTLFRQNKPKRILLENKHSTNQTSKFPPQISKKLYACNFCCIFFFHFLIPILHYILYNFLFPNLTSQELIPWCCCQERKKVQLWRIDRRCKFEKYVILLLSIIKILLQSIIKILLQSIIKMLRPLLKKEQHHVSHGNPRLETNSSFCNKLSWHDYIWL